MILNTWATLLQDAYGFLHDSFSWVFPFMNILRPSTNSSKSSVFLFFWCWSPINAEYNCSKNALSCEETEGTHFFTVYHCNFRWAMQPILSLACLKSSGPILLLLLFTLFRRSWISLLETREYLIRFAFLFPFKYLQCVFLDKALSLLLACPMMIKEY